MHITAETERLPQPGRPLTLRQKLAYGCGDLSSNLVWGLMVSFLMYYYTDIYILPPVVVAWLLLVPRVVDALCDPLFGYLVDRTAGKIVLPLMRVLAVPFGLTAFLCFLPLPLTGTAKVIWACCTYLILGAVYSAINTPYGALSNMMAVNTEERVSLNAYRLAGCQLGQLLIASAALPAIAWVGGSGPHGQQSGMIRVAAAIGCVAAALWIATSAGCSVRRPLPPEQHPMRALAGTLVGNRRLHFANLLTFLNFVVFCSQAGMAIHYTRFILHRPHSEAALLLMCTTAAAFVGTILLPLLAPRFGMRRTYMGILVLQAASLLFMLSFRDNFGLFLIGIAVQYLGHGPVHPLNLSILSEAIDEGRERTGIAAAGVAFAINALISKVAVGGAGFFIATFLAWGHYTPSLDTANRSLSFWLNAGFIGLPLVCITTAFICVFFSRRTEPGRNG